MKTTIEAMQTNFSHLVPCKLVYFFADINFFYTNASIKLFYRARVLCTKNKFYGAAMDASYYTFFMHILCACAEQIFGIGNNEKKGTFTINIFINSISAIFHFATIFHSKQFLSYEIYDVIFLLLHSAIYACTLMIFFLFPIKRFPSSHDELLDA